MEDIILYIILDNKIYYSQSFCCQIN